MERRALRELRMLDAAPGSPGRLAGYAAVFGRMSLDLGGFREQLAPGTFARSLAGGADVRALVEHDPARILGRSVAGTLRLSEDAHGLSVEIDLPDTAVGRDVSESVRRGDLDAMSFGFRTVRDEWAADEAGPIRTVIEADVFDVSVVAYPAYPQTEVALRSLARWSTAIDLATRRRMLRIRESR